MTMDGENTVNDVEEAKAEVETPTSQQPGPVLVLTPPPVAAPRFDPFAVEKEKADKAAAKKKQEEEVQQFPFSVTVGQVYDGPMDLLLDLIRKQDIETSSRKSHLLRIQVRIQHILILSVKHLASYRDIYINCSQFPLSMKYFNGQK